MAHSSGKSFFYHYFSYFSVGHDCVQHAGGGRGHHGQNSWGNWEKQGNFESVTQPPRTSLVPISKDFRSMKITAALQECSTIFRKPKKTENRNCDLLSNLLEYNSSIFMNPRIMLQRTIDYRVMICMDMSDEYLFRCFLGIDCHKANRERLSLSRKVFCSLFCLLGGERKGIEHDSRHTH